MRRSEGTVFVNKDLILKSLRWGSLAGRAGITSPPASQCPAACCIGWILRSWILGVVAVDAEHVRDEEDPASCVALSRMLH